MPEKSFDEMTLNEVFDLEDLYTANAGRSVVSKEGIARWKRKQARKIRRPVSTKKRHSNSNVAAR